METLRFLFLTVLFVSNTLVSAQSLKSLPNAVVAIGSSTKGFQQPDAKAHPDLFDCVVEVQP